MQVLLDYEAVITTADGKYVQAAVPSPSKTLLQRLQPDIDVDDEQDNLLEQFAALAAGAAHVVDVHLISARGFTTVHGARPSRPLRPAPRSPPTLALSHNP